MRGRCRRRRAAFGCGSNLGVGDSVNHQYPTKVVGPTNPTAVRIADAAGQAMAPDVPAPEWAALLEAVVDSPVRRTVRPVGLPESAGEDLRVAVRRAAGQVPELARLLGLPIPPPPGPRRPSPSGARGT